MLKKAVPGLHLRKLADKSTGERYVFNDFKTGARILVNPDTPGEEHEPWPFVGIKILDDPVPTECRLSTNLVEQGMHERWIEVEGEEMVHRPGGPTNNPWRLTHSLRHVDEIVIHTVDGDVRYEVTRQPDKYVEDGDDDDEVTTEIYEAGQTVVDKFYDLKLVK